MDNIQLRVKWTFLLLLFLFRAVFSIRDENVKLGIRVSAWEGSCALLPCEIISRHTIDHYLWFYNSEFDKDKKDFKGVVVYHSKNEAEVNSYFKNRVEYRGKGAKDCTILLKDLKKNDTGSYDLRQIWQDGERWMSKSSLMLTVSESKGLNIHVPEMQENKSVTLTCSADYYCPVYDKLIWHHVGMTDNKRTTTTPTMTTTTTTLTFVPTWEDDNKNISCVLQRMNETKEMKTIQLNVKYAPRKVQINSESPITFREGNNVTLECSVESSNPDVSITWYKDSKELKGSEEYKQVFNESGEYYCLAKNSVGTAKSNPVEISVLYGPKSVSIQEPEGNIIEGSKVTLTCISDGNPPVHHYIWYKNGGEDVRSNNSQYQFSRITEKDSGSYECKASNAYGSVRSMPVQLDVKYLPQNVTVVIKPDKQIREGTQVTFNCVFTNGNPPDTNITWHKNKNPVIPFKVTKTIQAADAGSYSCKAGNKVGSSFSNPVDVDVLYGPKSVSIKKPEGNIMEGSKVTLTCISDANPPADPYLWYKNGVEYSRSNNSQYQFSRITKMDSGSYECTASNAYGSVRSMPVQLDVQYPPKNVKVVINPENKQLRQGTQVTFDCVFDKGNPVDTKITWHKKGIPVAPFKLAKTIEAADAGSYSCEAENKVGSSFSNPVDVDVLYPPKNSKCKILNGNEKRERESAELKCPTQEGNPKNLKYEWFKYEELYGTTATDTLIIPNLQWTHAGTYSCRAINIIGRSMKAVCLVLKLQYSPKNVTVGVSPGESVTEYTSVTLDCTAKANPPILSYTWYHNNKSLETNHAKHILASIQLSHAGEYHCYVTNEMGSSRSLGVHLHVSHSFSTITKYIAAAILPLILIILTVLIIRFRFCIRFKTCRKTDGDRSDSSFFVLKKAHNELSDQLDQQTASDDSLTEQINYSSLQYPVSTNGQESHPRTNTMCSDTSDIYSVVKKPITAEYENIESIEKTQDDSQDELHYSTIANLNKGTRRVHCDPEVEYAMLKH
ncbi:B-cell receptor CD22 isoform X2 [Dendropsophus ebraccatus]